MYSSPQSSKRCSTIRPDIGPGSVHSVVLADPDLKENRAVISVEEIAGPLVEPTSASFTPPVVEDFGGIVQ